MGRIRILRGALGLLLVMIVLFFLLCRCRPAVAIAPPVAVAASEPTENLPHSEQGHRLFKKLTCNSCHMIDGRGAQNAPDLSEVATKYIKIKGDLKSAQEFFRNHITDPDRFPGVDKRKYPFVKMPQIKTTPDQRELLIDYLTTRMKKE